MEVLVECKPRDVVLRRTVRDKEMHEMVEARKAQLFRTLLSAPRRSEIHTHSVKLVYEVTTMLEGTYSARYYRRATHTIKVGANVGHVEVGGGTFYAKQKSRLARSISPKGSNSIGIDLEEYVSDEREGQIFVDHHGRTVSKFAHPLRPRALESYPKRILGTAGSVRTTELTQDALVRRLCEKLAPEPIAGDVRDLDDKAVIRAITHIHVPTIEARLVGPKKRIKIMRIDAVSKKRLKA